MRWTTALLAALLVAACGPSVVPSPSGVQPSISGPTSPTSPPSLSTGVPTAPQTISPTALPPGTFPIASPDATAALLSHVPEEIRGGCVAGAPAEPVLALVTCSVGDAGVVADYAQYPDSDTLAAAYNERRRVVQIDADSGLCFAADGGTISATPNRWPAEHSYDVGDQAAGRYLCANRQQPTIAWTDERLLILGVASAPEESIDQLVRFWVNDSGPVE